MTFDPDADTDDDPSDFVQNTTSASDLLRDVRYLNAVTDMGTRLTRILSGTQDVTVKVGSGFVPAPAWQQNAGLFIEPEHIRPMLTDAKDEREVLTVLIGLILHEYGHFDFTPRPDNATWKALETSTYERVYGDAVARLGSITPRNAEAAVEASQYIDSVWQSLNCLEDQRQELLVSTKYPRARAYFRLLSLRMMLRLTKEKGRIPVRNYSLYYGRRHIIPASIIRVLRADHVTAYGEAKTAKAEALVDEYITLSATTNPALVRMWGIAVELWELFRTVPQSDRQPCLTSGHIGARVSKREQDQMAKDGKSVLDQVDAANAKQAAKDAEKHKADAEAEKAEAASGSDKAEQRGETAQDATPGDSAEDADLTDADEADAGSRVTGAHPTTDGPDADMDAEAQDAITDLLESMLDKAFDKVAAETAEHSAEIRARIYGVQAAKLARLLSDIAVDLAPTDTPRMRSGSLDMKRLTAVVSSNDLRVFHRKQQDLRDEAVMGIHVVIDRSSSMASNIRAAMDAAHTIAKASDMAGHFTKVSMFGYDAETVKGWNDTKWTVRGGSSGSTNIQPILEPAWADFRAINVAKGFRNNVMFIVTDGEFDDPDAAETKFKELRKRGVHIILIGINTTPTYGRRYNREGKPYSVEATLRIRDATELEGKMRNVIKRLAVNITRDIRHFHD